MPLRLPPLMMKTSSTSPCSSKTCGQPGVGDDYQPQGSSKCGGPPRLWTPDTPADTRATALGGARRRVHGRARVGAGTLRRSSSPLPGGQPAIRGEGGNDATRAVPLAHEVRHATVVGPQGARLPAQLTGRSFAHPTTHPTHPTTLLPRPPTQPIHGYAPTVEMTDLTEGTLGCRAPPTKSLFSVLGSDGTTSALAGERPAQAAGWAAATRWSEGNRGAGRPRERFCVRN